jgi:hypothetical protein
MRNHAVHSEADPSEILVTPIERTIEIPLRLKTAIVKILRRNSHERDTTFELVAYADDLMLVHVKIIIGTVVQLKKID